MFTFREGIPITVERISNFILEIKPQGALDKSANRFRH